MEPSRWRSPVALLVLAVAMLAAGAVAGAEPFGKIYATGDKASLTEWGRRYENGEGVAADVDRAIRLYCKAATQGHAEAQYYLGWVYSRGRGVKRDDALAAAWLKKAASQNHPQARNVLRLLAVKPKTPATCPTGDGAPTYARGKYIASPAPPVVMNLVRKLALEYRLDPELVLAVVRVESNFNAGARSPKNAQGLMQLIPETAARFGVDNVWDPEQNLRGGMAYLRWLLDHFEGDVTLALAGYNAGEGAVRQYRGVPPFDETREYIKRIVGMVKP